MLTSNQVKSFLRSAGVPFDEEATMTQLRPLYDEALAKMQERQRQQQQNGEQQDSDDEQARGGFQFPPPLNRSPPSPYVRPEADKTRASNERDSTSEAFRSQTCPNFHRQTANEQQEASSK